MRTSQSVAVIPYSQFQKLLDEKKVAEVTVGEDQIKGTLKEPIEGTKTHFVTVKVDTSAPGGAPSLSFSNLSANAHYAAGTLYISPSAGGTFTVTAAGADAQSGIASYTFGSLNTSGGSNFTGSQSGDHFDYGFSGTTTAPSTDRTVKATNRAGLDSPDATYSIVEDSTAPVGGSIVANGGAGYDDDGAFSL